MRIKEARIITGYKKMDYDEYYDHGVCDYCKSQVNRYNSYNELKTSYEYDEYNYACNKCVIGMAKAIDSGVDLVVGTF